MNVGVFSMKTLNLSYLLKIKEIREVLDIEWNTYSTQCPIFVAINVRADDFGYHDRHRDDHLEVDLKVFFL